MSSPNLSSTIRRSVALSSKLVEEARSVAPELLRDNFNRLVQNALEEYIRHRKALAFQESMALMARDPGIHYECRTLEKGLGPADGDGLGESR
jgi:hypothetical protein